MKDYDFHWHFSNMFCENRIRVRRIRDTRSPNLWICPLLPSPCKLHLPGMSSGRASGPQDHQPVFRIRSCCKLICCGPCVCYVS